MDVLEERLIDVADYYYPKKSHDHHQESKKVEVQRELSQAMIPGKHLVKVEIEESTYELKLGDVS